MIVGTPGTTVDWVFKLKFFDPRQLKVFVLDEADVMVSQQGHQEQSIRIKKLVDLKLLLIYLRSDKIPDFIPLEIWVGFLSNLTL